MTAELFATAPQRYDLWYERHRDLYQAELAVLRMALSPFARGLEVGVGTGRFASALGFGWGVDPARPMLQFARLRGCRVVEARGEELPFRENSFDCLLLVAALCFIRRPERALAEAGRVLAPGGRLILGIIDRESGLGAACRVRRDPESFYRSASFLSVPEAISLLPGESWLEREVFQSVIPDASAPGKKAVIKPGFGEGGFVVIAARKPGASASGRIPSLPGRPVRKR